MDLVVSALDLSETEAGVANGDLPIRILCTELDTDNMDSLEFLRCQGARPRRRLVSGETGARPESCRPFALCCLLICSSWRSFLIFSNGLVVPSSNIIVRDKVLLETSLDSAEPEFL